MVDSFVTVSTTAGAVLGWVCDEAIMGTGRNKSASARELLTDANVIAEAADHSFGKRTEMASAAELRSTSRSVATCTAPRR